MSNLIIFEATRFEAEAHNHNVHIRVQSRSGSKCTTTVEGLSDDLDLESITRSLKRQLSCSGTVLDDPTFGKVIKMTGDQRVNIFQYLVSETKYTSGQVTIH